MNQWTTTYEDVSELRSGTNPVTGRPGWYRVHVLRNLDGHTLDTWTEWEG